MPNNGSLHQRWCLVSANKHWCLVIVVYYQSTSTSYQLNLQVDYLDSEVPDCIQ